MKIGYLFVYLVYCLVNGMPKENFPIFALCWRISSSSICKYHFIIFTLIIPISMVLESHSCTMADGTVNAKLAEVVATLKGESTYLCENQEQQRKMFEVVLQLINNLAVIYE